MTLVVVGALWQDRGVEAIVDVLSRQARIVVPFSGAHPTLDVPAAVGASGGFSAVENGEDTTIVLGSGTVVDLERLFDGLEGLSAAGVEWSGRVLLSDRAHLVLPEYRSRDDGDTAYELKGALEGTRVCDLVEGDLPEDIPEADRERLDGYRGRVRDLAVDLVEFMRHSKNHNTLLYGGPGALLDPDLGAYPYVRPGSHAAAAASLGGGIGPRCIDSVIGVCRCYSLRDDDGPFPSEIPSARDAALIERLAGFESTPRRGANAGEKPPRPRFGYLDLVALRYSCAANSIEGLALMGLDALATGEPVRLCVAYENDAGPIVSFPASPKRLAGCRAVTKALPGWNPSIADARSFEECPKAAQDFVRAVEEFTDTPVDILSVGERSDQVMIRRDPWTRS